MRCLIASALFRYSSVFVFKRTFDFSFISAIDVGVGVEIRRNVRVCVRPGQRSTLLGCHEIVKSGHVLGIRFGVLVAIFRVNGMGKELEGGLRRVWCGICSI